MLTEAQRHDVGERMMAAEMRSNYYADLCSRYLARQRWITFATLLCSSGAVATVLSTSLPARLSWTRPTLTLITAALSLFSFVSQYLQTSTDCAELHSTWNRLATEYDALWNDLDADNAHEQLKLLISRGEEASKRGTKIAYKEKLMRKWQKHVEMHRSTP
jgi:hypothetical protein